jgi:hypothetical protein
MRIHRSDLTNIKQVISERFPTTVTTTAATQGQNGPVSVSSQLAQLEALWAHGVDPIAPTFFVLVNKADGTGTPYSIATLTYATAGSNTVGGTITTPANMNVTVGGTSYATTTAAMTALVALNASSAP